MPFEDAKKFARNLNFKSSKYWKEFAKTNKKPSNIPAAPQGVYADSGWKGWADFLGK